ncbi:MULTISPECIES: VOC family protein [unclassified Planococcus (in: firmicutes)]|uniref:VOC family protein n=1 Tax=unclassified Planococcus (in: firmicutes) TaxID=2662419 RepID=UPI000C33978C|nr:MULTISPECIES: VOC family protein [unclassified Planococcus (in: firmicutes)]AUD13858.1 glutathione transferase [Planococcus sp. MB-3u-03]PKG45635.1 glutathione transferase [Planococcus sp. Urea-trap-24]PKG88656.1 glutathione transferase [Planococcus sp. Urea-3u-39]PKH38626.1 glutathione transferase [Planococcus sp. MB-3u-09]
MIKGLYEAHLPVRDLKRSIEFYTSLELELAYETPKLAFFWIVKGQSWVGLWETDKMETPYPPSLRHIAFHVDIGAIRNAMDWLAERGIEGRTAFGFSPEEQPVILPNRPYAHAAVYFHDPDGNSLEFIAPLDFKVEEEFDMMSLAQWDQKHV